MSKTLFTLPVEDATGSGKVIVSMPVPNEKIYLVTFAQGKDNRLTSEFCYAILLALDILEHRYEPGVVITTSGIKKFYSNGLDLDHSPDVPESMYLLWRRLLTYSRPTIALVNGHAFAGGFMLAMMHDYRVMNPSRGYLCANELELGSPLRPPMTSIFREKVSPLTLRKLVLEAFRFKGSDALEHNLVDRLGDLNDTLSFIEDVELVKKAQPGVTGVSVYSQLKTTMWRETIQGLEAFGDEEDRWRKGLKERMEKDGAVREEKIREWENKEQTGKAKL